jgi:hypothetical protein
MNRTELVKGKPVFSVDWRYLEFVSFSAKDKMTGSLCECGTISGTLRFPLTHDRKKKENIDEI